MKHLVLGKRDVSFTAEDGRTITGVTLYVGYETDGVEGMATDKLFVSTAKLPKKEIVVGADVDIAFNRAGKVDTVMVNG